jgi:hypothetical protein
MYELHSCSLYCLLFSQHTIYLVDYCRLWTVESKVYRHVGIKNLILKLFNVMYTKVWFYSVLPVKYFNKILNQAMVNSFYVLPNSAFITSLIFDTLCVLIKEGTIMYLKCEYLSHNCKPAFLRFCCSVIQLLGNHNLLFHITRCTNIYLSSLGKRYAGIINNSSRGLYIFILTITIIIN